MKKTVSLIVIFLLVSPLFSLLLPKVRAVPTLSNGYVTPTTGTTSTQFYYYVTYYDPGGIPPELATVNIDGNGWFMTLWNGVPSNGVYRYSTTLSVGTHTYYFMFTTVGYTLYLPPPSIPYSGPIVNPPQRRLTVYSAHDSPNPPNGNWYFNDGQLVFCSVTSPVTEGNTLWTCTGWSGTGSVPSSGSGTSVAFTITQDSSITWNWQTANGPPITPTTPSGSVLCHLYNEEGDPQGPWTYSSYASDPDGDDVQITFSWDDGSSDSQSDWVASGEFASATHSWRELLPDGYQTGMHKVGAKAVDIKGAESTWSSPLEVTVVGKQIGSSWAGYVQELTSGSVTSIEGKWIQPGFSPISFGNDGSWVGIGGVHGRLLQAGIAVTHGFFVQISARPFIEVVLNGTLEQRIEPAWYELLSYQVSPGDVIYASINSLGSNQWEVSVNDISQGWTWTKLVVCEPDLTTAEWIHEPGANAGPVPLPWAPFTPVDFTLARFAVDGITYKVGQTDPGLKTLLFAHEFQKDDTVYTSISPLSEYEHFTISCLLTEHLPELPITGISLQSSAELGVYDGDGNHLGHNSTTGLIDWQIPNAIYLEDETGAQYSILFDPNNYNIELLGNEDGEFHLHMQALVNETVVLDQWVNETITTNETKTHYLLHQISPQDLVNSKTVIGQGYNCSMSVVVVNNGNYTETFNVTISANATIIGTQLVTLAGGNSTTIVFTWNTTGVAYGNYTISAMADIVPGETDTADNILVDGTVFVTIIGDVNGDASVNASDLFDLSKAYGSTPEDPNCDLNSDNKVDALDLFDLSRNYGMCVYAPPVIDSYYPLTDATIFEGEQQEFNVTYHDPDGDPLVVQWLLNSITQSLDDSYTFVSNYDSAGVYNVTVVVSDGFEQTSHEWTLTVLDVNRPPTIDSYTPLDLEPDVNEGSSLYFTHTSSDPDGDPLSYSWLLDDVEQATSQNWTYAPGYEEAGTYNVTLIVSDSDLFDSQQWNLTVLETCELTIYVFGNGTVIKDPDLLNYTYGAEVNLTAVADLGWSFVEWSGDLTGSENPTSIVMDGDKVVNATFIPIEYTLTVNVFGNGSVTLNATGPYYYGDVVELTAVADPGWAFSEWSEDLSGSVNPEALLIDADKVVNATFVQEEYTLTINVFGNGSVTKDPNQLNYTFGTEVNLTAVADLGWSFVEWSGDLTGSENPATIVMDGDKVVNVSFLQGPYTLTINVFGNGSVSRKATGPYYYGDVVELTAFPDPGWNFTGWNGDVSGSVNPEALLIDADKVVNVTFTQEIYSLTVNVEGGGVVNLNDTGPYYYGDVVELTAVPDLGWLFSLWSGDLTGSINPETLFMDGDKVVNATFTQMRALLIFCLLPNRAL